MQLNSFCASCVGWTLETQIGRAMLSNELEKWFDVSDFEWPDVETTRRLPNGLDHLNHTSIDVLRRPDGYAPVLG